MEKIDPDPGTGGPELLVGSLFAERYRLIRMASAGANTVIFDADDTASGRPVTLKIVLPAMAGSPKFLDRFDAHMGEACLGSISEIFDAEEPYTPRGCVAQAWSVAEILRSWSKTAE